MVVCAGQLQVFTMPFAVLVILIAISYLIIGALFLPTFLLETISPPSWLWLVPVFLLVSWCLGD